MSIGVQIPRELREVRRAKAKQLREIRRAFVFGKYQSRLTISPHHGRSKKVVVSDRDESWPDADSAAQHLGVSPSTIRNAICQGQRCRSRTLKYGQTWTKAEGYRVA